MSSGRTRSRSKNFETERLVTPNKRRQLERHELDGFAGGELFVPVDQRGAAYSGPEPLGDALYPVAVSQRANWEVDLFH